MTLRRALVWLTVITCFCPASAYAVIDANLERELKILARGEKLERHIPDAKFRVAVFTYEDPDDTKIGDALATLIGRQLLVRSTVSSFGVITYKGGLAPSGPGEPSYFDKVDKVASAQDVTLSVWGMVRRRGSSIVVDTYFQIPTKLIEKTFVWRVKLPDAMKGDLVAHLRPERILAQSLELPARAVNEINAAGLRSRQLRSQPSDTANIVSVIPTNQVYWLQKEQADWIMLSGEGGQSGWVRTSGGCAEDCRPLLDAADFGASLLAFMEQRRIQASAGSLSADARAITDQLQAYELIDGQDAEALRDVASRIGTQLRAAKTAGQVPAGGAGLANAWVMDNLVLKLQADAAARARETNSDDILATYRDLTPEREQIRGLAFQLAEASVEDPDNSDVLHNLAVLFEYAGDSKRASLARSLAEKVPR
jgi:hypothetical protein